MLFLYTLCAVCALDHQFGARPTVAWTLVMVSHTYRLASHSYYYVTAFAAELTAIVRCRTAAHRQARHLDSFRIASISELACV